MRRWRRTSVGWLAAAAFIAPWTAAGAGATMVRGIQAPTLALSSPGTVLVGSGDASTGQLLRLSSRAPARARITTPASRAIEMVAASTCPRAGVLRVALDRSSRRVRLRGPLRTHALGWPLAAGAHLLRLSLDPVSSGHRKAGRASSCRSAFIDRVDLVPAAPTGRVLLGAAVRTPFVFTDPSYAGVWLTNFDSLTPENEMKMLFVEPDPGRYDFANPDAMVALASSHAKAVRGHTLVYGNQLPSWVTHPLLPWSRAGLLAVMQDYIDHLMTRYAGRVSTWDVVNEAFNDDGSYRDNIWYEVIGPDYVEQAFRFARAADPTAQLFYNDIGVEADGPKQRAILAMVGDFRARGVPLDGIGFQNHTTVVGFPAQAALEQTFARVADLGLRVEITEMDVATQFGSGSTAERDALQLAAYRAAATACWNVAACQRLTTWGVDDAVSWIGVAQTPLLFDDQLAPKPAFAAVDTALHRR